MIYLLSLLHLFLIEKPQRYFTTGIDRARYHVHAVLRRGLQFTFQSKRNDTCISEQFRLCVGSNYELFWFTSLRSVIGLKKTRAQFPTNRMKN